MLYAYRFVLPFTHSCCEILTLNVQIIWIFYPETKGSALESIHFLFEDGDEQSRTTALGSFNEEAETEQEFSNASARDSADQRTSLDQSAQEAQPLLSN